MTKATTLAEQVYRDILKIGMEFESFPPTEEQEIAAHGVAFKNRIAVIQAALDKVFGEGYEAGVRHD